jgi:tRNA (guanine26-N2/guanine27-N2)-dimethyltransferase
VRLAVIREGKALLYIPDPRTALNVRSGKLEPAWLRVFYNPEMELNRDLSVQVLNAYASQTSGLRSAIDALAGTGVRGLRYLLEIGGLRNTIINDIDHEAFNLIKRNIALNALNDVAMASNRDANALLFSLTHEIGETFDVVEIDPFGSPAPFISASVAATSKGGVLAVTATDLAVLGGPKRHAAKRKYWLLSPPPPTRNYREVALRVLIGFMAREAASHDKALRPLFSFSVGHYARVFVTFERGGQRALRTLEENLGCIIIKDGVITMQRVEASESCYGPIWIGDLWDKDMINGLLSDNNIAKYNYQGSRSLALKVLELIGEEAKLQRAFHQRLDEICSATKHNIPKMDFIRHKLESWGYVFAKTHMSPVGFRTDAPPEAIVEACRNSA